MIATPATFAGGTAWWTWTRCSVAPALRARLAAIGTACSPKELPSTGTRMERSMGHLGIRDRSEHHGDGDRKGHATLGTGLPQGVGRRRAPRAVPGPHTPGPPGAISARSRTGARPARRDDP